MKLLSYLGLGYKANSVIFGSEQVLKRIRSHGCYLVILSSLAANNTFQQFRNKTNYYHIPFLVIPDDVLVKVFPKRFVRVICLTNKGIADAIIQLKGADLCETKHKETNSSFSKTDTDE